MSSMFYDRRPPRRRRSLSYDQATLVQVVAGLLVAAILVGGMLWWHNHERLACEHRGGSYVVVGHTLVVTKRSISWVPNYGCMGVPPGR